MQNLHVILRKEDLDPERLDGKVAVVFDVLFATSTIVTAFAHGVADVLAATDPDAARAAAADLPAGRCLLAGERNLEPIPGFTTYAPLALTREPLAHRRLIYSTTNGTVALGRCAGAAAVYAAALLNGAAVAEHVMARHPDRPVLLVCAGAGGGFNIEDFLGAGYVVDRLLAGAPDVWLASDAAVAARELFRALRERTRECLLDSRLGRLVQAMGQGAEVEHAARVGIYSVVPFLRDGVLVRAPGTS
jgi:2-phosphosulfolactate phosphatase